MKNIIRLNDAVEYAQKTKNISKTAIAAMLWPETNEHNARVNYGNLAGGRSQKIDISAVPIICKELGVSADFLFGLSDNPCDYEPRMAKGDEINRLCELEASISLNAAEMRKIINSL